MTHLPQHFCVWAEIPVTDLDRGMAFYNQVFETELKLIEDEGPNPFAVFPTAEKSGIAGHIYPGTPAKDGAGPTIHLKSPGDLHSARQRVTDAGGTVVSDVIEIPDGTFFYCQDPDGNSIGIFQYRPN